MGVWVAKHCSWVWWFGWVMCTCYVLFFVNFSGSWSLHVLGALHDQGTLWLSSTHYVHNTHALTTMAQVLHNFLSIFVSSCRQFKYVMLLCPLCSWISKMWSEPQYGDWVNNNNNNSRHINVSFMAIIFADMYQPVLSPHLRLRTRVFCSSRSYSAHTLVLMAASASGLERGH